MIIKDTSTQSIRRYTRAGKIRIGGMLPTKSCRANGKAMDIYRRGVELGMKFDAVADRITAETGIQNPLYPDGKLPYFRMAAEDFPMPGILEKILAKYGEDRGDGIRRLYSFPVNILSKDDIRVGFSQSKGEPLHESFIENGVRMCRAKTYEKSKDGASRSSKVIPIYKVEGACVPENCRNCLAGRCSWKADIWFQIPGIGVRSMFQLSTGSEYATDDVLDELERIKDFNQSGGQTWLTKKQMATRHGAKPYVICLMELDADPTVSSLTSDEPAETECGISVVPSSVEVDRSDLVEQAETAEGTEGETDVLQAVMSILADYGIHDNRTVLDYISGKFGKDWKSSPDSCQSVMESLKKFQKFGSRAGRLFIIKVLVETHNLDNMEIHNILKEAIAPDYILHDDRLNDALDYLRSYVKGLDG